MKRKLLYLSSFFIFITFLFIYACQKEKSIVTDNTPFNANSVEKNAVVATAAFDELNDFAQSGFDATGLKGGTFGTCPVVSVNFMTSPFSITLDWGTGCLYGDGITRSGTISMTLSGLMTEKNSVATMKIENFIADGMKISGTTKITYLGPNTGNNWPRYSIFSEGKIEFSDKSVVSYRSESVRLQAEGTKTTAITDDVWRTEIQSASGVNKDGTKWSGKTTKVMIKKGDCKWYNSGTFVITPEKGDVKTIDFGDGTCDNKATMKVGDKTTDITL
ncbi:MAG: hypothetical protein NTX93_12035 [Bacteroidia bacterium]|nr:hypothetical protein [Bacteroidia bacterium]